MTYLEHLAYVSFPFSILPTFTFPYPTCDCFYKCFLFIHKKVRSNYLSFSSYNCCLSLLKLSCFPSSTFHSSRNRIQCFMSDSRIYHHSVRGPASKRKGQHPVSWSCSRNDLGLLLCASITRLLHGTPNPTGTLVSIPVPSFPTG